MAMVTSFESLPLPTRSDLRQFAELFRPLYEQSTDEARRQAVAALSRCSALPEAVSFFIGCQPIAVAALFLTRSKAISDQTLIDIARSQGAEHARAIAMRDNLSPAVVDALTALHNGGGHRRAAAMPPMPDMPAEAAAVLPVADLPPRTEPREAARLAREEALRDDLRHLVSLNDPQAAPPRILSGVSPLDEALLVRFARARQAQLFSRTLAQALGASQALAHRIVLDVSGAQLAATLVALGMAAADIRLILCRLYPHLAQAQEGRTRAHLLLRGLDPAECVARVASWRRADHYTETGEFPAVAANEDRQSEAAPSAPRTGVSRPRRAHAASTRSR